MVIRVMILVLLSIAVLGPMASADMVSATPVDGGDDAQLQDLQAQTSQDVADIQGGLSQAWAIVGVVLVAAIVISVVV